MAKTPRLNLAYKNALSFAQNAKDVVVTCEEVDGKYITATIDSFDSWNTPHELTVALNDAKDADVPLVIEIDSGNVIDDLEELVLPGDRITFSRILIDLDEFPNCYADFKDVEEQEHITKHRAAHIKAQDVGLLKDVYIIPDTSTMHNSRVDGSLVFEGTLHYTGKKVSTDDLLMSAIKERKMAPDGATIEETGSKITVKTRMDWELVKMFDTNRTALHFPELPLKMRKGAFFAEDGRAEDEIPGNKAKDKLARDSMPGPHR